MARRGDGKNYLPYAFHESQKARIKKSMKHLSKKEQDRYNWKFGPEMKKREYMRIFWDEWRDMFNESSGEIEGSEWWNKIY